MIGNVKRCPKSGCGKERSGKGVTLWGVVQKQKRAGFLQLEVKIGLKALKKWDLVLLSDKDNVKSLGENQVLLRRRGSANMGQCS